MDMVIVIAALILNPIAKRKRVAETVGPVQIVKVPTSSTVGSGDPPEKPDLESGDRPVVDPNLA